MGDRYQEAGVDVAAGQEFVKKINVLAKKTHNTSVLSSLGGFAGLFELPTASYQQPVLVSSTDGVGTKLKLALQCQQHHNIGIDVVAMCVNDVIAHGATPLFFLDYYATGQLDQQVAVALLDGIRDGCQQAGMALIGGETAEMPGLYAKGDYDIAGFCVGIAEKANLIHPACITAGDQLIALASTGVHANGFSLIRHTIDQGNITLNTPIKQQTLSESLLTPTRIYCSTIQHLLQNHICLHGIAHITGGGIIENLPRILPGHLTAHIQQDSWEWPEIFRWLQQKGRISTEDMRRTFNCGVGMIISVDEKDLETCLSLLADQHQHAWHIGEITPRQGESLVWEH